MKAREVLLWISGMVLGVIILCAGTLAFLLVGHYAEATASQEMGP